MLNRFVEDAATSNLDLQSRQRVFEDIIIQRIKVIQAYVKKQVCKLKAQINTSSSSNNNQPVILNSIHNDGMALEMKIKDIVKWKFEAHEQKAKLKEDKLMQLELN